MFKAEKTFVTFFTLRRIVVALTSSTSSHSSPVLPSDAFVDACKIKLLSLCRRRHPRVLGGQKNRMEDHDAFSSAVPKRK